MKKKNYILFFLLGLTPLNILFAQGENLFDDDVVHEIRLTFENTDFWTNLTSNYDNNYPDVPYIMANATSKYQQWRRRSG